MTATIEEINIPDSKLARGASKDAAEEAMQRGCLRRPKFRVVRMVHGFVAISSALYLIAAFVFSVCLLLAAFTL